MKGLDQLSILQKPLRNKNHQRNNYLKNNCLVSCQEISKLGRNISWLNRNILGHLVLGIMTSFRNLTSNHSMKRSKSHPTSSKMAETGLTTPSNPFELHKIWVQLPPPTSYRHLSTRVRRSWSRCHRSCHSQKGQYLMWMVVVRRYVMTQWNKPKEISTST